MKTYNFEYSNSHSIGTEEHEIIQKLSDSLIYQDELIEGMLEREIFSWDDINNGFDGDDMVDVYHWLAGLPDDEYTRSRLDRAGIPYLYNDYGLWIGRTDTGSSQDVYFLPILADALYNR